MLLLFFRKQNPVVVTITTSIKNERKKITKDFSTADALKPHLSLFLVNPLLLDYAESDEVVSPIVGFVVI